MERVIVYARHRQLEDALRRAHADYPEADLVPRNANSYAEGQHEPADLVLVDDRYPEVADDYRNAGREVEMFAWDGRDPSEADLPDEGDVPAPFRDQFASETAYEAAVDAGIEPPDLEGVEPDGKTGYTTRQIREMASEE